ncbi:BQ5605_C017g08501 [Microbotryum silenes-dioicae]|uniref:BQ5605_C017g08501 protein n=1 Tax=Microbotryum silenes-dioicae TaxID=796604 RepID=A0A2X0MPP3_9BASI|nr:BQ5605_C017g08501 [Microbotryum silenes-dioicae]
MRGLIMFELLALMMVLEKVQGHMTIWSKSMYGVGKDFKSVVPGQPCDPIGPDLKTRDEWWFRGPAYRALPPPEGEVTELIAGKSVTFEISCHVAWTSFGWSTTKPGSHLDACPGNPGAYHSGDPLKDSIDENLLSGCALAIADVDDIEKVTPDNLVIFSVQSQCIKQKITSFEVPAAMPPCKGKKCICGWFWLANTGAVNFYMTAFDCAVTNPSPTSIRPIQFPLLDPYICENHLHNQSCIQVQQKYAKRPIYAYNEPQNVKWVSNEDRAGYHEKWGWVDGAQEGIFGEGKVVGLGSSERGRGVEIKGDVMNATTMAAIGKATITSTKLDKTTSKPTATRATTTIQVQYRKAPSAHRTPEPQGVKCKNNKSKHAAAVLKLKLMLMMTDSTRAKPRIKPKHKSKHHNHNHNHNHTKQKHYRHTKQVQPRRSSKTQGRRQSSKTGRPKLRMTSYL